MRERFSHSNEVIIVLNRGKISQSEPLPSVASILQITHMDQTLNSICQSLTFLLEHRDAGEGEEGGGGGGSRPRPRLRHNFSVAPSHESLPSYEQLSSSPSSFSSNNACLNPALNAAANHDSC